MNRIKIGKSIRIKLEITEIDFGKNRNNIVYGFEDIINPSVYIDPEGKEIYYVGFGDYRIEIGKDLLEEKVIELYILNRMNVDYGVDERGYIK